MCGGLAVTPAGPWCPAVAAPTAPLGPPPALGPAGPRPVRRGTLGRRRVRVLGVRACAGLVRVRAQLFDRGAAPRAGEGAVEVPSARVAVVHDAGRLSSVRVTFLVTAVKIMCGTACSGVSRTKFAPSQA
ncbi:hypothetical protein SM007_17360 [Streptomyces avermitilis]|nr:hypothetical protein [Streptomyces sp. SID5469]OOV30934.1 hypothetical protein SM007_17360 [Streptomyces avermitilis]